MTPTQQQQARRPIMIVDGMNLFIRSFMVNEAMNSAGDPVGGILGFLRTLKNLTTQFKPEKVIIAWEQGGASPRRKHIYPEYKANRAKDAEPFSDISPGGIRTRKDGKIRPDGENKARQLMVLTKALGFLPVYQLFLKDVEADDIVAWCVKSRFMSHPGQKIVVSNDKDFYQLLEDTSVRIYNPATKSLVTQEKVLQDFGLSPRNITLARAVVGDESDNIDGVPGVGLKTVAKRFSSLSDGSKDFDIGWLMEECRNNLKANKKAPKCFSDILSEEEKVKRNWQLMYLGTNSLSASQIAKLNGKLDEFRPTYNYLDFMKTFTGADIPVSQDIEAIPGEFRFLLITS